MKDSKTVINPKMQSLGETRSVIRDLFEYGLQKKKENPDIEILDFSLGNPSTPPPKKIADEIGRLLTEEDPMNLHGYTSAVGDFNTRSKIAEDLAKRFRFLSAPSDYYMTCGAAASLTISLKALTTSPEDEVIVIAPYFPEYKVFVEGAGAKLVVLPIDEENFFINFEALKKAIHPNTKAIIVNSPNNPSGAVYPEEVIRELADLLREKEREYGHPIYIIADEPYRELVYGDVRVPFIPNFYDDTIVGYSFSKSLSLPGERIGYILISPRAAFHDELVAAVAGAGRTLGFVCAPSLMQKVVASCLGTTSDMSEYRMNRDLLYTELTKMGYSCVRPDGAFYLFLKSPTPDANEFMNRAKEKNILIVPADTFGAPGYLRIAYCVPTERIQKALPFFEELIIESHY